jgi:hypothetical protein
MIMFMIYKRTNVCKEKQCIRTQGVLHSVCLQRIPELFTACKYPKESVNTVIINVFKDE